MSYLMRPNITHKIYLFPRCWVTLEAFECLGHQHFGHKQEPSSDHIPSSPPVHTREEKKESVCDRNQDGICCFTNKQILSWGESLGAWNKPSTSRSTPIGGHKSFSCSVWGVVWECYEEVRWSSHHHYWHTTQHLAVYSWKLYVMCFKMTNTWT